MPPFAIRRLGRADAEGFRILRLEGLRAHPEAFGASWEEEKQRPAAWFADRLERSAVFGGLANDGSLVGAAGLAVQGGLKERHKGILWGMYVRPQARRTGLADALVARVIEEARGAVEEVKLTVATSNEAAIRLYIRAGFVQYGMEKRALKVGAHYHDELLMALPLYAPA
ncbi:GNAT family N-acetyltransferase [Chelativorans salis]|uniref:GNAT family N-acetyltransferase n=1 Tax=Chelativorans salis TaxID=2978478 RepID=A0ABT2LMD5_9HYPH|nr:GNAT family N-acetyltransferase [Chelativorans sp. EGI FJ00035]MCT7375224.1 GNAT family N-acetyltransferase [Chelativorans sp. EGI FJ00035]